MVLFSKAFFCWYKRKWSRSTFLQRSGLKFPQCVALFLRFFKTWKSRLSTFQQYCIFRHVVVTGTLSWLVLVFTNFGAFIQYLAECKVTSRGTSHHYSSENTNHPTYCSKVDRRAWNDSESTKTHFYISDTKGPSIMHIFFYSMNYIYYQFNK